MPKATQPPGVTGAGPALGVLAPLLLLLPLGTWALQVPPYGVQWVSTEHTWDPG